MTKEALIIKNQQLFWYVNKSDLLKISDSVLVEFLLNYGSMQSVEQLFSVMGVENVASVFSKSIKGKRNNYFPQVKHFFDLYFKKNVPQYPF